MQNTAIKAEIEGEIGFVDNRDRDNCSISLVNALISTLINGNSEIP